MSEEKALRIEQAITQINNYFEKLCPKTHSPKARREWVKNIRKSRREDK